VLGFQLLISSAIPHLLLFRARTCSKVSNEVAFALSGSSMSSGLRGTCTFVAVADFVAPDGVRMAFGGALRMRLLGVSTQLISPSSGPEEM
jgi:hypothetical protein